jgi:hypothetical protein
MRRLRLVLTAALLTAVLLPVGSAAAGESYVCWYVPVWDPVQGDWTDGMRCRIDGEIHEPGFPGEGPIEVPLVYDLGFDAVGECYYRRTGPPSGWVVFGRDGELLNFWWDVPGGFVGDAWIRPCTSEPATGEPPITSVYRVLENYEFVDPVPELVPDGIGLAGARTFVFVEPPEPTVQRLNSPEPSGFIDIEIRVVAVEIEWGDDAISTIPESEFELFAPHPDGVVGHQWEAKGHYAMGIDYDWFVRWRVNSGPWQIVAVPDTEWTAPYQVDEVVGRRSG